VGIPKYKYLLVQSFLIPLVHLLLTWSASAQLLDLPSAADPARLPPRSSEDPARPPVGAVLEIPTPKPSQIHLAHPIFLQAVRVRGALVYSEETLSKFWEPHLGREIASEELDTIARAITRHYQANGYMLSRARLMEVDEITGTATFEVIEGFVSEVRFINLDNKRHSARLQEYARKITESRPLKDRVFYRYLYLMDDLPGVHTSVDLEINPAEPAALLEIEVSQKIVTAGASLNNSGTRYIGPWRTSLAAGMNGLLGMDEEVSLGFATATPLTMEELLYAEARWQQIIDGRGTQLIFGGTWYRSQPDIRLAPPAEALTGSGSLYSIGLRYPLIRSGKENLSVMLGYNHEQVAARLEFPDMNLRLYRDRLRSLAGVLSGRITDEQQYDIAAAFSLTRGLRILGAGDSSDISSRMDGLPDFTKINASVSCRRSFGPEWRWAVNLAGNVQYSFDPLLAGEEFGLGGVESVRGYDPSAFSGDSGAAGSVELRYDKPHPVSYLSKIQGYFFYDAGTISNRGDFQVSSASATAAGAGLRFQVNRPTGSSASAFPRVDGYAEIAWPIDYPKDISPAYDAKFLFGVVLRN
jgi:hemolysin activation/secretion protein